MFIFPVVVCTEKYGRLGRVKFFSQALALSAYLRLVVYGFFVDVLLYVYVYERLVFAGEEITCDKR